MSAISIALALALGTAHAAAQGPIRNAGFEEGQLGGMPDGWFTPPAAKGYDVELVDAGPHGGQRAVRIASRGDAAAAPFGNVMQYIDATPFRGKRIRLRAFVRTEPAEGGAALWLRVDRADGAMGFFDNMADRPIRAADWKPYVIVGDIAPDAQRINFGMMLHGSGRAWLDDVSLDTVPPAPAPEAARALTNRGLANEMAFARLFGYVRFFHPTDEAASTYWVGLAIRGVRAVESAAGPAQLATALRALFQPIAPSLVVRAGPPPAASTRTLAAPTGARQVVAWRHVGVGLGGMVYHSDRIRGPASAIPDSFPDPLRPLEVDLGGGVSASIPLAVFADSAGTLPRGKARADDAEALSAFVYSGNDRATRLADVALAWTVFQHFYPYFDVAGTDWSAELPRALRAAAVDRDAVAFETTLRRMVAALHDGHGNVFLRAASRLVPAVLLGEAEGRIVVLAVGGGETKVRRGDVVLKVDGRPVAEALAEVEALQSAATPQWARYRALQDLLAGSRDKPVALEVAHPDGPRESVTLTRTGGPLQVTEVRPAAIGEVRPGIWYVDLDRATTKQLTDALPQLAAAKGLVFDMRGYPRQINTPALLSRLSHSAMTSAQWNFPVTMRPDRAGVRFERSGEWTITAEEPYLAAPRAFITDGRAISYAESTMGIVEHYRLGEIVGEPTAGTNGNVNPFVLPGGYFVAWTGMKVLKHDGSRHHGVGILPTIPAHRTLAGIAAGRDELLEKAIEVVTR